MRYLKKYSQISHQSIESICQEWGIENYSINGDGIVDVDGDVDLSGKDLTRLPLKFGGVSGNFYCYDNQLTSLEGAPQEVGGYFYCGDNQLTSLEGAPQEVGGDFSCSWNGLTTLEGAPSSVGGDFYCSGNRLITLKGMGDIGGDFYFSGNPVQIIWKLFRDKRFLEKINHIYTDLWMGDGWTLQGDVLEQIAEELDITLPDNWVQKVEGAGYKIVGLD